MTAALLSRLGILQASMGNYGLALRYFQQRDEYPHVRPLEELGLRIAIAEYNAPAHGAGTTRSEPVLTAAQLQAIVSSPRWK